MNKNKSEKELFSFIRSADIKNVPSLKSLLETYEIPKISIEDLLTELKKKLKSILLIDARSEKEFNESAVPYSVNFPVLNNSERHDVGLIYKKYSQSSALWLAMQYANPKSEALKIFLEKNNASNKKIFIYCWRGSGRSSYLGKMICDLGYKPETLTGGYKSFRRNVNNFFSGDNLYGLIELSGLTGCGKSELLQSVAEKIPVIDLESAARHFSSLLGHIPYEILNYLPVSNQSAFENNIYSQIFFNSHSIDSAHFLIESESKKVGNFEIPKILYEKLESSPSIKIVCSLENRISRIVRDYFGNDLRGIGPMKKILTEKEKFFKQQLSNKVYTKLIALLDESRANEFTEIMIKQYYDKKYKEKAKTPVAEISTDNMETAKQEIFLIYKSLADSKN